MKKTIGSWLGSMIAIGLFSAFVAMSPGGGKAIPSAAGPSLIDQPVAIVGQPHPMETACCTPTPTPNPEP
jgi:hypothetical protein